MGVLGLVVAPEFDFVVLAALALEKAFLDGL